MNAAIKILITFVFIAHHLLKFSSYTIPKKRGKIKRCNETVIILMIIRQKLCVSYVNSVQKNNSFFDSAAEPAPQTKAHELLTNLRKNAII